MHDLRISSALRQLSDLDAEPDPPNWLWAVAHLEPSGRLRLPAESCRALGAFPGVSVAVRGVCHPTNLVLRSVGGGRSLTIDRRGRLDVPVWLRRGHTTRLVVGTQPATSTVVVALTSLLDALGDQLAGGTS